MNQYRLRFVPLGGIVGVTKNMYVYELWNGDEIQDILVVDCGIGFPQEQELGVDFVIPDVSYLKDKTDKIRAVLLTHGHEDHITALPYHYKALGRPKVFGSKLTVAFVNHKSKEHNERIDITEISYDKEYKLGGFTVKYIHVCHSIPDTCHILIKSPVGNMYHGPDYKLDLNPPFGGPPDFYEICKAGKDGVLALMSDCLGSERDGLTLSESIVGQTFEDEMRKTKGKFIMTTFSSNISRIKQCIDAAIKFNRKIVFMGRSMRDNTKMAMEMQYLNIPFEFIAKEEELMRLPPKKVCIIAAGSQGQFGSALSKITRGLNKYVKIKPGDKIVFSSDPIPGNEEGVSTVIEDLTIQGADVVYPAITDQLHTSGHGNQEDMKFLMRFTEPKYFIPIGGTIRHQRQYQRIAEDMGYKKESVFLLDEGETVWFTKGGKATRGESVATKNIYVDSYGVGDVGTVVLRDRKTLASEGVVVAVMIVDKEGRLSMKPRVLSRGLVFEKAEDTLFDGAVRELERVMKPIANQIVDHNMIRKQTIITLEDYFMQKKGKRPMIVCEIVQL